MLRAWLRGPPNAAQREPAPVAADEIPVALLDMVATSITSPREVVASYLQAQCVPGKRAAKALPHWSSIAAAAKTRTAARISAGAKAVTAVCCGRFALSINNDLQYYRGYQPIVVTVAHALSNEGALVSAAVGVKHIDDDGLHDEGESWDLRGSCYDRPQPADVPRGFGAGKCGLSVMKSTEFFFHWPPRERSGLDTLYCSPSYSYDSVPCMGQTLSDVLQDTLRMHPSWMRDEEKKVGGVTLPVVPHIAVPVRCLSALFHERRSLWAPLGTAQAALGMPLIPPRPALYKYRSFEEEPPPDCGRFAPFAAELRRWADLLPALQKLVADYRDLGRLETCSVYVPPDHKKAHVTCLETATEAFAQELAAIPRSLRAIEVITRWATILSARGEPTLHLVRGALRSLAAALALPAARAVEPAAADPVAAEAARRRLSPQDLSLMLRLHRALTNRFEEGDAAAAKRAKNAKRAAADPGRAGADPFSLAVAELEAKAMSGLRVWQRYPLFRAAEFLSVTQLHWDPKEKDWNSSDAVVKVLLTMALQLLPKPLKDIEAPPWHLHEAVKAAKKAAKEAEEAEAAAAAAEGRPVAVPVSRESMLSCELEAFYADATAAREAGLRPEHHWYHDYWALHDRRTRFPHVWRLTRLVLACPASSIPADDLFGPSLSPCAKEMERFIETSRLEVVAVARAAERWASPPLPRISANDGGDEAQLASSMLVIPPPPPASRAPLQRFSAAALGRYNFEAALDERASCLEPPRPAKKDVYPNGRLAPSWRQEFVAAYEAEARARAAAATVAAGAAQAAAAARGAQAGAGVEAGAGAAVGEAGKRTGEELLLSSSDDEEGGVEPAAKRPRL